MATAELDKLINSVYDKSQNTKKAYRVQYNKFSKMIEELDMPNQIHLNSQKKLLELALEQDKPNSQQALINIAVLVRRLYGLKVDELIANRETNKHKIQERVKEVNKQLSNELPTLNELDEFTDHLYNTNKWVEFIINWLLLNYQVRNLDLNFKVILRKKDATDPEQNYMWFTTKKCVFIRNVYKTANVYNRKINTIVDKEFHTAIKQFIAHRKHIAVEGEAHSNLNLITNEDQIGYIVKKATFNEIGEANYVKVVVNAYRGNLQKLKEISENRGTSVDTLINYYDLKNQ